MAELTLADEIGLTGISQRTPSLRKAAEAPASTPQPPVDSGAGNESTPPPPASDAPQTPPTTTESEAPATPESPVTPPTDSAPGVEAPATEESGLEFNDFVITEAPEGGTEKVSAPTPLTILGEKLKQQFASEEDVLSYIETVKKTPEKEVVRQPYVPGLEHDEETSALVAQALSEGIIDLREVTSGALANNFTKVPEDPDDRERYINDLVHDYLIEADRTMGTGKKTSAQVLDEIAEMSDVERNLIARSYAKELDSERNKIISQVRVSLQKREAEKQARIQKEIADRQQFNTLVSSTIDKMDVVSGTHTRLTPEQKQVLAKVTSDPTGTLLRQAFFGTGETPDVTRAANLIARVLFPNTIDKDNQSAALNKATKNLIDRESNIKVGSQDAIPVTTAGGEKPLDAYLRKVKDFMNS